MIKNIKPKTKRDIGYSIKMSWEFRNWTNGIQGSGLDCINPISSTGPHHHHQRMLGQGPTHSGWWSEREHEQGRPVPLTAANIEKSPSTSTDSGGSLHSMETHFRARMYQRWS